eukprot:scaffold39178_cov220-Skeletonema_marinoi.AAC.9
MAGGIFGMHKEKIRAPSTQSTMAVAAGKRAATALIAATLIRATTAFHIPKNQLLHAGLRSAAANDSSAFSSDIPTPILEGGSTKAIRLRKQLQEIWNDPTNTSPIILTGPKGSGKSELAEEIVYQLPSWQTKIVHRLTLDDGIDFLDTILGTASHPGLFDDLSVQANTTLVLKGFQSQHVDSKDSLDRRGELIDVLDTMVTKGQFYSTYENSTKAFLPRIVGCTQRPPQYFTERCGKHLNATFIKVPSFEQRKSDIQAIAAAKIKLLERKFGLTNIELSKEGRQRLLDHRWEVDGDSELDSELYNGLQLLASEKKWNPFATDSLEPRHLLVNAYDETIRKRLLYDIPFLRNVIMSPWVFGKTLTYIVTPVFILVNLILFLGPQTREENAALTFFWAGWWPGIMLVFPFLGRIWCTVCPFMAVGNIAQEIATNMGVQLKKWPSWAKESGPAFAFGLFYAILMWEELWNLPQSGALSACLLLLITSGAVVNSVIYEKRLWCRYMCPIGAMNKMFATLSMTEVRTFKSNCEGCTTAECINGGSPTVAHDNYALKGCTMDLKNNQLRDMGDRESPEFNLRPLGQDYGLPWLLPKSIQSSENMALSQGSVLLHFLPKILTDFGMDPTIATVGPALDTAFATHTMLAFAVLGFPGGLSFIADTAAVPLESSVKVLKRQLTRTPAENAAIKTLYESMLKQNVDVSAAIKEWDQDGDGTVSDWEVKEAFKLLDIPEYEYGLLFNLLGKEEGRTVSSLFDDIQELYFDVQEAQRGSVSLAATFKNQMSENDFETKLTFVEIFNRLDKDGNGFLSKDEFLAMSKEGYFKKPLSEEELNDLFYQADVLGIGRLNLFEFMSILRKNVKIGIQEIGYGYLPLAWGSLTAYWLGLGMQELGLTLVRVPSTFNVWISQGFRDSIPQYVFDTSTIHAVQVSVMLVSYIASVALTQKLCDDNRIGPVRFGTHAVTQSIGAAITLYLMLSPEAIVSAYR